MAFTPRFPDDAGVLGRWIGDPERLLPGEDPRTVDTEAASHWAGVHSELLRLREGLLHELLRSAEPVQDPTVAAGLRSNLRTLELAANRSRRRLAFWAHRLQELALTRTAAKAR